MIRYLFIVVVLSIAVGVFAQKPAGKAIPQPSPSLSYQQTAAYAELALRKAEFEADLEALLLDYTDDFPKVKELRFALEKIKVESLRLSRIGAGDQNRATSAVGKLMTRKIEAEIDLWKLSETYADEHPDVRRARKRVEIFEKAIKEILG